MSRFACYFDTSQVLGDDVNSAIIKIAKRGADRNNGRLR